MSYLSLNITNVNTAYFLYLVGQALKWAVTCEFGFKRDNQNCTQRIRGSSPSSRVWCWTHTRPCVWPRHNSCLLWWRLSTKTGRGNPWHISLLPNSCIRQRWGRLAFTCTPPQTLQLKTTTARAKCVWGGGVDLEWHKRKCKLLETSDRGIWMYCRGDGTDANVTGDSIED